MHLITYEEIHFFWLFCNISIISLTPLINYPGSLKELTILMISFTSCYHPSTHNFFMNLPSAGDAAEAVNPNGIKTFLANG